MILGEYAGFSLWFHLPRRDLCTFFFSHRQLETLHDVLRCRAAQPNNASPDTSKSQAAKRVAWEVQVAVGQNPWDPILG